MPTATAEVAASANEVALQGVFEVTRLLNGAADPQRAIPDALDRLCDVMQLDDAAVGFADSAGLRLLRSRRISHHPEHMPRLVDAMWARVSATASPWIVESEWGEQVADAAEDLCGPADLDRSAIAVPIQDAGCVRGILCIERLHGPGDQAEFCFDAELRPLLTIARLIVTSAPSHVRAAPRRVREAPGASPERGRLEAELMGTEPRWRALVARARRAARSNATIVLRGESGTGKELLARLIHAWSPRWDQPFVAVNCAALSDSLLESELFGHDKGAFTGAVAQHKGRFELAHRGTLFLDEIGEISASFQAALLRALQLGEFERVGGGATVRVDVRVIAATHRDLEQEVQRGRFRADLYYRISVIPLMVPPLRERRRDIAALAQRFLDRFNATNATSLRLDDSCLALLMNYAYPGNVRELENFISRAASLCASDVLTGEDFEWLGAVVADPEAADGAPAASSDRSAVSRQALIAAMEQAGWVQARAGRLLGLTPRQVGYALRKFDVTMKRF